jgi:redox-sensitive bicupin YhaK (pirin superfamily)
MSNIQLIIEERETKIGNFLVGRLLPFRKKRSVGPFVFIDHMGPAELSSSEQLDIAPHPHIGLSTLTYLFEGHIMHRDSLGTEIEISPGAVNWMTAGKGIVHSERTPERLRNQPKRLHGLQIWVALPKELEDMEPAFHHIEANALPSWIEGSLSLKLIAGKYGILESPVPVYSPLFFLEISSVSGAHFQPGSQLFGESGLYILKGEVIIDNTSFGPGQLLIADETPMCSLELKPETCVYLFGGYPFTEERHIYWNFVHSDKTKIDQAKSNWTLRRFPEIPGETDWVPLP